jgi:hypothetical protein
MIVQLLDPDPILRDDPVRPKISPKRRIEGGKDVYAWVEDKQICAVICISHNKSIPKTEKELLKDEMHWEWPGNIILYSVWSYKKGSATKLVRALIKRIRKESWCRIVTMSPKTEMAKNFHLKNGAKLLQENKETINYEY